MCSSTMRLYSTYGLRGDGAKQLLVITRFTNRSQEVKPPGAPNAPHLEILHSKFCYFLVLFSAQGDYNKRNQVNFKSNEVTHFIKEFNELLPLPNFRIPPNFYT